MTRDKQLRSVSVQTVRTKQKLDQALNMKEFAVLAGIAYSVAREWFQLTGFPAIQGKVFWQDFVLWRRAKHLPKGPVTGSPEPNPVLVKSHLDALQQFPPRAARILADSK